MRKRKLGRRRGGSGTEGMDRFMGRYGMQLLVFGVFESGVQQIGNGKSIYEIGNMKRHEQYN